MIAPDFLERLACPVTREPLRESGGALVSTSGRAYPVIQGIPVLFHPTELPDFPLARASWAAATAIAAGARASDGYMLETVGVTDEERAGIAAALQAGDSSVDPVVSWLVAATCGRAYKEQVGRLTHIPLQQPPVLPGPGEWFLDVGCSWGRWCLAAAGAACRAVGLDPSLGAVMAARRLALQLGVSAELVVGDARHLPFRDDSMTQVFSYSVLHHFSDEALAASVHEMRRVLRPGGACVVQLANRAGLRNRVAVLARSLRAEQVFDVRYRSLDQIRRTFAGFEEVQTVPDCYFGLGLRPADAGWVSRPARLLTAMSEALKRLAQKRSSIGVWADSVWVTGRRGGLSE